VKGAVKPPAGLRFECTECGRCCTNRGEYNHLYLSDEEVVRLARYLRMLPVEFRQRYTFTDEYGWTQLFLDERCSFLDVKTGRCQVYPARPVQCRTFPFWRGLVRDGAWTEEARELCEGVDRGPVHPMREIQRRMRQFERSDEGSG
jgi:Fe-S-cluster containining protein